MSRKLLAALVCAGLPALPAAAETVEADALVCAYLFSASAEVLLAEGRITTAKRDDAQQWASLVLARYVPGSEAEKRAALARVESGRDRADAVSEFAARGRDCLRRFPI